MSIENINFDFSTNYQLNTTHSLTQREYKDTQREDLNRRKITINNQTGNIIDANIEFYPAKDTDVDGTPITAAILREFHNVIAQADKNAKSSFNMTNEIANRVANYLTQANTNVQVLESQIANKQGTTITINEQPQVNLSLEAIKSEILLLAYPIGSIYLSVNAVNPNTLFGGNWIAWGSGRVPVGIGNNGETNYQTAEMTGGSENSVAQHIHSATVAISSGALTTNSTAGGFQIAASGNGKALTSNHTGFVSFTAVSGGNSTTPNTYSRDDASKNNRSELTLDHSHTIQPHDHAAAINQTGSVGGNRQPFITCYMWKRIS